MLKKLDRYWNRPGRAAYIFILPSLVLLFIFAFIPLCASIVIGFMHMDIYFSDVHFDGFNNFVRAFQDERFWNALKNTLLFAIIEMVLQIVVGLLVANALVSSTFFNKFSRTILFIPVVISTAATGVMFGLLLDETIGYIPYLCGMLGFPDATFFRNASTAMGTIIAMTVWKNFGYTMSILVVGIQGVSQSYYEAARIDGASKVQQFFYITLPGILPNLGFCIITNLIGALQVFDQVFVTTQGGPQYTTETLVFYIYKTGFRDPFDLGYASAMSVLLLIAILILAVPVHKKMFMSKD